MCRASRLWHSSHGVARVTTCKQAHLCRVAEQRHVAHILVLECRRCCCSLTLSSASKGPGVFPFTPLWWILPVGIGLPMLWMRLGMCGPGASTTMDSLACQARSDTLCSFGLCAHMAHYITNYTGLPCAEGLCEDFSAPYLLH